MTDAAADTLLSNSTASLGSIGSTQRSEMPALNPASARSRIASRLREASLGRKPLDSPAASASRIKQAVVQPVGATLPELDALRNHAVAAPVRGPKGALAMAFTGFLHGGLQRGALRHALALRVLEPMLELAHRIAVGVCLGEACPHVLLSQLGDIHHGILPRRLAHLGVSQRCARAL